MNESPDANAALAAYTRETLAALGPGELLDTAAALAAQCRALRQSLVASASIYVLPDELLSRVLRTLPPVSRLRACAVSRRFRLLIDRDALCAALNPARMLVSGRALEPGDSINSPDGRFTLMYQHDANFVLYYFTLEGYQPVWALQTVHVPYDQNRAGRVTLRSEGVVAVRNAREETYWSSPRPGGSAPYRLVVRNEGDFAIIDANDAVVWAATVAARPGAQ